MGSKFACFRFCVKWHAKGNKNSFLFGGSDILGKHSLAREWISSRLLMQMLEFRKNSKPNCKVKWQTTNNCHRHWLTMLAKRAETSVGGARCSAQQCAPLSISRSIDLSVWKNANERSKGLENSFARLETCGSNKSLEIYGRCRNEEIF